jgi:hypothetical protein
MHLAHEEKERAMYIWEGGYTRPDNTCEVVSGLLLKYKWRSIPWNTEPSSFLIKAPISTPSLNGG